MALTYGEGERWGYQTPEMCQLNKTDFGFEEVLKQEQYSLHMASGSIIGSSCTCAQGSLTVSMQIQEHVTSVGTGIIKTLEY